MKECGLSSEKERLMWNMWVFPKIVVTQNGWFIMDIPIKMDDLGVPLFSDTPMFIPFIHVNTLFFLHPNAAKNIPCKKNLGR